MRWLGFIVVVTAVACDEPAPKKSGGPAAAASTVAVAASSIPSAGTSELAPLHPQAIAGAEKLLDKADAQADARVRPRMAAGILKQLEAKRLEPRVIAALAAASERKVTREHRVKAVWEGVSRTPRMLDAWNRACHAGPFQDGGRIVVLLFGREKDPRKRAVGIFGPCRLEQNGLMALEHLTLDYDLVLLAHTLHAFFSSTGGVHPVERRALVLLARGGRPPQPAISAAELPEPEEQDRLVASAERALHARLREGIALLEGGGTKRFFEEIVHPHELGGLRLDEAAKTFARKGKSKALLVELKRAKDRPARDDGEGEASIPVPWTPDPDARERLRFQLHRGVWHLRL